MKSSVARFVVVLAWLGVMPPGTRAAENATSAPAPAAPPLIGGLPPVDATFDIKVDLAIMAKGGAEGFRLIEQEFARDPRPHVKARYGEFLIEGRDWGAPEGQGQRGWQLTIEAYSAGSVHALRALGWDKFRGRYGEMAPRSGFVLLKMAADAGNANAMTALGDVHLRGLGGLPVDLVEAERWIMRAAILGKPHLLSLLAKAHEEASPPNRAKAAELYYEGSTRGSGDADRRLLELFEQKEPFGTRAYHLALLWKVGVGFDPQTTRIRGAIDALLQTHPEDPLVLLSIGRVHLRDLPGIRDPKKAYAFFDQAARLGSDDARAERAHAFAEGIGVAKDPARALAEWRELEAKGNARALAQLGYYSYWGSLGRGLLPKDAANAFDYSRRAGDAGDWFGQINTGTAYEFGIGTPTNYAFAAQYYRAAARRGSTMGREKVGRILPHVLK